MISALTLAYILLTVEANVVRRLHTQVVRDAFRRSLDLICKKEQPSGDMGVGAHGEVLDGREKPPEVEPFRFSTSLATEEMARACVAGVREDLDKVAGLDVHVFCNAGGPNRGWWVVGLPTAGGKGNALKYVMDAVGVVPSQTLCCGDRWTPRCAPHASCILEYIMHPVSIMYHASCIHLNPHASRIPHASCIMYRASCILRIASLCGLPT